MPPVLGATEKSEMLMVLQEKTAVAIDKERERKRFLARRKDGRKSPVPTKLSAQLQRTIQSKGKGEKLLVLEQAWLKEAITEIKMKNVRGTSAASGTQKELSGTPFDVQHWRLYRSASAALKNVIRL
uniref:Uncharacterized protein n=1 Tax=Toxoplasma gondii TgCATBr9 TaxID=943120 RepID=A0A2T6IVV2_TOXGO|nr:hypothetical protein TGBR9_202600 [Toxoplasma gondii TgCATBr9]